MNHGMNRNFDHRDGERQTVFVVILSLIVLALALMSGCSEGRYVTAALGSSAKPYQEFLEDPVALTAIKTIAVFPFENRAPQPGFDSDAFANKLANQLAAEGKVRVLFPKDILAFAERENRAAKRHNAELKEMMQLGIYIPESQRQDRQDSYEPPAEAARLDAEELRPRPYYNPIQNSDEAVRLARRAKADAIIMGEVTDFDSYMRPKMTLTMRLIATGNSDVAAKAIAELTQWGVPRPNSSAKGVIYIRQEAFDSTIGSVGMNVSKYGLTHFVDNHPYDTEVYIRSMSQYYEVVAHQLANSYVEARKKAIKEAEKRAREEAKLHNRDQDAAAKRIMAMVERDSRIPDFETDRYNENYFDQAFVDKNALLDANNGDKRIQSWRPDGRNIRPPSQAERLARDGRIPENERGRGLEGYSAMSDASFPDADAMIEYNLGDGRDRSWRPDYYNHANPEKSAPLYGPQEFRGNR